MPVAHSAVGDVGSSEKILQVTIGLKETMNSEQEARMRRNYVSNMYPGLAWKEKVANWGTDRITAVYLRFIKDDQKPKPETPEELERDIQEDDQDEQFRLF